MRIISHASALLGFLFISGQGLRAEGLPGTFEVTSGSRPTNNMYRQDYENPKEKVGVITGTIKTLDRVSGNISVQDAKGAVVEFSVETNTSVQVRHLQISLDELNVGDRVTVHDDIDPRLVNRIDRI